MSARRALVLLLAILALGIALRLTGIGALLPHHPEDDANILYQAQSTRGPQRGKYPFLLVTATAAVLPAPRAQLPMDASLEAHLERAAEPLVRTRLLLALLSALIIPSTFLTARFFLSRTWSLLAAALLAVSPLLMCYSIQARPHAAEAALSALAVWASLRLTRTTRARDWLLAGLTCGLAIAAFPSGLFTLGPLLLAGLIAWRGRGLPALRWFAAALILIAALAAWSYAPSQKSSTSSVETQAAQVLTPTPLPTSPVLPDSPSSLAHGPATLLAGSPVLWKHRIYWELFNGRGILILMSSLASLDPALLLLLAAAALMALGSIWSSNPTRLRSQMKRPEYAVLAAFAVPFLLLFGSYSGSQERFFLPALPVLAIVASSTISRMVRRLSSGRPQLAGRLTWVICGATLALPLATSLRLAELRRRPDTFTLAARWIQANVQPFQERVLVSGVGPLPLRARRKEVLRDPLQASVPWIHYETRIKSTDFGLPAFQLRSVTASELPSSSTPRTRKRWARRLLKSYAPEYVLVSPAGTVSERASQPGLSEAIQAALSRKQAERIQVISPFSDDNTNKQGFRYSLGPAATLNLWRINTLGPAIEIYALR